MKPAARADGIQSEKSGVPPPRVSIGMPAYNAEEHIRYSLDSLLAQTFSDIEIIVSDNASTDATPEILQELARRDGRIKVIRQPINVGANLNYTTVAERASGTYFKWASANDWCAPTHIQRCVEVLDSCHDVVLVAPRTRLFTSRIEEAQDYDDDIELRQEEPSQRLIALTTMLRLNNAVNGVMRLAELRRTPMIRSYYGADIVLMGHLALLGKIGLIDEPLYYRRMDESTSTALQDAEQVRRHHFPTMTRRALFQNTKHLLGWWRVAFSARMSLRERQRVVGHVLRRAYWDRGALLGDLRQAARYVSRARGAQAS